MFGSFSYHKNNYFWIRLSHLTASLVPAVCKICTSTTSSAVATELQHHVKAVVAVVDSNLAQAAAADDTGSWHRSP